MVCGVASEKTMEERGILEFYELECNCGLWKEKTVEKTVHTLMASIGVGWMINQL